MPPPTRPNIGFSSAFLFDAIIVGAGPAGLAAALALCRVKQPVAVFSNSLFRNERAHHAHSILSRDHTPPSEIRKIAREQIEAYGTAHFVERTLKRGRKDESANIFEVEDQTGEKWRAKKMILATGVSDVLPTHIPGYEENWGDSIWQCLFCDGIERQDRPAGTLGAPNGMSLHNISMIQQIGCPKATIFTNGDQMPTDEGVLGALEVAKAKGAIVDERRIKLLRKVGNGDGIDIHFEDGSSTEVGFLAHKPDVVLNARDLIESLGVEIVEDGMGGELIKRSEPFGETSVKGVFAAGDVGTVLRQVPSAMNQGQVAGVGAHIMIGQDRNKEISERLKAGKS